ncbi:amino acid/auxin permease-like protein, partial [Phytophthora infestans T30-4]
MAKKPFFTAEDAKTSFNLFCCIYGIGTLGMPGNFARAGPTIAVVAMAFMAFANIYSSVAMSKVILLAPTSVKTFGDLGEWAMGQWGRWLCIISQMEGSGAAFAGCLGTIIADVIGVGVVMHGMRGHPSVPFPELKFSQ